MKKVKKTIKLQFFKEDFKRSYLNSKTCPITTALKRAGYNYRHTGYNIRKENYEVVCSEENSNLKELTGKVLSMYENRGTIKDFEFDLEIYN